MKRFCKSFVCMLLALFFCLSGLHGFGFSSEAKAETQREAIVRVALGEEGVSGCPNKYTYAYGEIGGTYEWGWCAAFVYWCAQQVGIPHSIIKRNASAEVNSFKTPYYQYSASSDIQKGDILYMLNKNGRHIGLVADVDDEYIYTIEGNVKNSVTRYTYRRSDGYADWSHDGSWQKITHYGVPAYEEIKAEPNTVIYPVSDGIYKLSSHKDNNDYVNFSLDSNNIHVRTSTDGRKDDAVVQCQYFRFNHIGDGWYTITDIKSGMAMTVANGGTAPGTNIQYEQLNKGESQLFRFYDAGDGYCYIKSKLGCFVDIQSEDYTVNDNVWTYKFNGSTTQKWKAEVHEHSETNVETKKATCTQEGSITKKCSVCRLITTEAIPMTEHSFSGGKCSVCGQASGESIKIGDVDGDGKISASDARLTLRASVGLEKLDSQSTKKADADKNDKITAADARLILRASVGLEKL